MFRISFASASVLVLPLLGGCGGLRSHSTIEVPATVEVEAVPADHQTADVGIANATARGAARSAEASTDETVLSIWRSAAFQRRLAESFLAESDIEPAVPPAEREALQAAMDLMAQEKDAEAIVTLKARAGTESSAALDFMLATIYFKNERFVDAVPLYEAAVQKKSTFRRAWKNLGLIHVRQGEFRTAALDLVRVIELGGGDAITYGLLAFAHASNDDPIAAESAYRMASLLDPATLDWRRGLAVSFLKQRRYADAAALATSLISSHPDRIDLWLLQANAYVGMNEPRRAAENLEFVDRLGQSTNESLSMLGDIYINDELYGLAADAYVRAVSIDQKGSPARALRAADALARRSANGESQRLIASIEKAYADRIDTEAKKVILKLRSRIALATGASEEEARVLEEVVTLDPLDGEALILLGQFYARTGQPDQAIFRYERAANLPAFEADAKYRHAQLLVTQGKYVEALPLLRRAQQVKPREALQPFVDQIENLAKGR